MPLDVIDLSEDFEELGDCNLLNQNEKEVFETSDVEDEIKSAKQDVDEQTHTPPDSELKDFRDYFEHFTLQNKNSDFSGRIDDNQRASFEGFSVNESVPQKLARIRRELEEIQISNDYALIEKDEIKYLAKLHDEIDARCCRQLRDVKDKLQPSKCHQEYARLPNLTIEFENVQKFLRLEQRLSQIEKVLGDNSAMPNKRTIISMTNELFRQIRVIKNNDQVLNEFKAKLEQINRNYEESIIGRRAMKDTNLQDALALDLTASESKINRVYGSYEILRRYREILPHLTKRMKTLNNMHFEVSKSVDNVKTLESSVGDIRDQALKWQKMIAHIDEKLDKQEKDFVTNREEVKEWVEDIELRIESLK